MGVAMFIYIMILTCVNAARMSRSYTSISQNMPTTDPCREMQITVDLVYDRLVF